jgi:hypothetical protein
MPSSSRANRTLEKIFRLGFADAYRDSHGRPFIKLLNWYTGFGKTYTAASFALDLFLTKGVIPVFLAPLQTIVTGFTDDLRRHQRPDAFTDDIERAIRERAASVPIYRLYSQEYHLNDKTFFQSVLLLDQWLHRSAVVYAAMEEDLRRAKSKHQLAAQLAECRSKCHYCLKSDFHQMSPAADDYEIQRELYLRAAGKALSMADRIVKKIISIEVRSRHRETVHRLMADPVVSDLVRRLYPLQAFVDRPGIIVGTASKAATGFSVLVPKEGDDVDDDDADQCVWKKYDTLFALVRALNTENSAVAALVDPERRRVRVATFIDEEEDSYWFMFAQRKSVINPQGRNDLNDVIAEFVKFADLEWPLFFERGQQRALARKVFENLWAFSSIAAEAERALNYERVQTKASFVPPERTLEIIGSVLRERWPHVANQFSDTELSEVFHVLVLNNDVQNDYERFRWKAMVLDKVRAFVAQLPRRSGEDDYAAFRRVRDLIFGKKFFQMSRSSYGEMLDQPSQTFFNASTSVMTTDYLSRMQLLPDIGNRTIRLQYQEKGLKKPAFTLLDYLNFVLLMAGVLAKNDMVRFTEDEKDRYKNLWKFTCDIRKLFKERNQREGFNDEVLATEPVDPEFFYCATKSVVSLDESRRQPEEYNLIDNVALSVSITSLRATPEEDLRDLLAYNNGVYLMSATGGLQPASSGSFNQRRLQQILQEIGGRYFAMSADELAVVSAAAARQQLLRQRKVHVVDAGFVRHRFPGSSGFAGLLEQFIGALQTDDLGAHRRMSRYKEEEVRGMVASLDRLLTTPLRSGLCLSLSMKWARHCLLALARLDAFVTQEDHAGYHFIIHPQRLPAYRKTGARKPIHIVLYQADQFRKVNPSQTGAFDQPDDPGQFNQEFMEALDVSNKKVLLWTAYGSAARGLNFITARDGVELDFELVYLINSPFYNRHTRPNVRGFHMESFQAMLQVLYDRDGGALMMTPTDFLYEFAYNRWSILEREHHIDLVRTIFQALGRVERRIHNPIPHQEIYMDAEVAMTLYVGTRYAPELRDRASSTQRAVLAKIDEHNRTTGLFGSDAERQQHLFESLRLAEGFQAYTRKMPRQFRSSDTTRAKWEVLFDRRMLSDPAAYLAHLRRNGIPKEYCDAMYLRVPAWCIPYTTIVDVMGKKQRVITDYAEGADLYRWVDMIAPANLLQQLPAPFSNLNRFAGGFADKKFGGEFVLLPQPWFVTEVIKGYVAEQVFVELFSKEFGVNPAAHGNERFRMVKVMEHPLCAEIYQKYDFYVEIGDKVLVAIDIKNWTRLTDSRKKAELEQDARKKHQQLRTVFPQHAVHAIYLNLHGARKLVFDREPPSGTISFLSMYVQSTLPKQPPWMQNANLVSALLWRPE